jgi:molecular chaperone GrpE
MSKGGEPPRERGEPTEVPGPVAGEGEDRVPDVADESASGNDSEAPASEPGDVEAAVRDQATAQEPSVGALAAQRDEYLDALRRLQADFENYKKRMIKQQTEHLERAAEGLVVKLLPVLDTLDLAAAHAEDSPEAKVVGAISSSLFDVLGKEGLERIDPLGQPFDPNLHDAVAHEPPDPAEAQEDHQEGGSAGPGGRPEDTEPQVSDVMRAGYRWKGRVLRPAMVKVKG